MNQAAGDPILRVRDLAVEFATDAGPVQAVNGVDFDLYPGETLGIVGESGSGKSVSVMSLLGLIPSPPGRIVRGTAHFRDRDLLTIPRRELRKLRGRSIAMIFQDPMTSLNPVFTVGWQIAEALRLHAADLSRAAARDRSIELLRLVGVPDAARRFSQYPHEFSGGMRQRAMIAMAISNEPEILIADEPTTALDVTIQAQVLEVLQAAQAETGAAMILITHDLGLVADMAQRIAVMYGGRVVESGSVDDIFYRPRHPYSLGLMSSLPRLDLDLDRLSSIAGQPPNMSAPPAGCVFHPRCRLYQERAVCHSEVPQLRDMDSPDHRSACHFAEEADGEHRRIQQELGLVQEGGA